MSGLPYFINISIKHDLEFYTPQWHVPVLPEDAFARLVRLVGAYSGKLSLGVKDGGSAYVAAFTWTDAETGRTYCGSVWASSPTKSLTRLLWAIEEMDLIESPEEFEDNMMLENRRVRDLKAAYYDNHPRNEPIIAPKPADLT